MKYLLILFSCYLYINAKSQVFTSKDANTILNIFEAHLHSMDSIYDSSRKSQFATVYLHVDSTGSIDTLITTGSPSDTLFKMFNNIKIKSLKKVKLSGSKNKIIVIPFFYLAKSKNLNVIDILFDDFYKTLISPSIVLRETKKTIQLKYLVSYAPVPIRVETPAGKLYNLKSD